MECNCLDYLEPYVVQDTLCPYGEIVSVQIYKCARCGKEYAEVGVDELIEV